jgi:putative addiction module component (TIGR02574 family)
MNLSTVLTEIASLSVDDRLLLVEAIWETIGSQPDRFEVTEPQKRELEHRILAHESDPGYVISWEEVKAQALARVR